jgi:hypothetical protein
MLPQLPTALNSEFDPAFVPEFKPNISPSGAARPAADPQPPQGVDHHCQICPNCSNKLTGHHCKLVCNQCGYYLSCADYY